MKLLAVTSPALLALSLVQSAHALPQQVNDQPTRNKQPKGLKEDIDRCLKFDDGKEKDAKKFWDQSRAGMIADDFINEHGVANWVQDLDKSLFKDTSDSFDCFGKESRCELKKSCEDYAKAGKGGAYYLFYSLQTVSDFLDNLQESIHEETTSLDLDIDTIADDFKIEDPSDKPKVETTVAASMGMLAGALGAMSVVVAPLGFAAGAAGIIGGLSTLQGNIKPKPEVDTKFEARLTSRVKDTFDRTRESIEDIRGALFGVEGKDQALIPKEMTRQAFDNAVVNALGDGQWLIDHSTKGSLQKEVKSMFDDLKQALAWMMVRHTRKGFWFIDTIDEDKCGDGDGDHPGERWDKDVGGCIKLMEVKPGTDDASLEYIPKDVHEKLFGNEGHYDLDREKTFKNSYECWKKHDGKVGDAVPNKDFKDKALPECWFGIPILKGSKHGSDRIEMDDFPGHKKGHNWHGKFKDNGLEID